MKIYNYELVVDRLLIQKFYEYWSKWKFGFFFSFMVALFI